MLTDEEFLSQVYDNQAIIHKVCRLYVNHHDDREDLFQEIIYQVYKSKKNFRAESKLTTWLYQIALNTAITFFKKEKKRSEAESAHHQEWKNYYQPQNLYYEALYLAIEDLSKIDKALIILYLDDISYAEIGKILGLSENNVAVKINRIKVKLRTITPKYLTDGIG